MTSQFTQSAACLLAKEGLPCILCGGKVTLHEGSDLADSLTGTLSHWLPLEAQYVASSTLCPPHCFIHIMSSTLCPPHCIILTVSSTLCPYALKGPYYVSELHAFLNYKPFIVGTFWVPLELELPALNMCLKPSVSIST